MNKYANFYSTMVCNFKRNVLIATWYLALLQDYEWLKLRKSYNCEFIWMPGIILSKLTRPCFKKLLGDCPIPFHWPIFNTQPFRSKSSKYWSCWVFYFIYDHSVQIFIENEALSMLKVCIQCSYLLKECTCIFHLFKYMHIFIECKSGRHANMVKRTFYTW